MPRVPEEQQQAAPEPLPGARLTAIPSPDVFGAGVGHVVSRTGAHLYALQARQQALEQHALAQSLGAQATADYLQKTTELTEQAFTDNALRPDLAKAQAYRGWKSEGQRVLMQYGGENALFRTHIQTLLAQHDAVRGPQLEVRTSKAISDNAKAGVAQAADQAVQDIVNADSPVQQQYAIDRLAQAYGGIGRVAMSDQAVHEGLATSTVQAVQGLADKEVAQNPMGVLARLSNYTLESPALAGLPVSERTKAIEERQKANEEGLAARMAMKKDVLDADLDVAMQRGLISGKGYLKLQEERGKQKEVSLMKMAVANRLTEDELANQELSPDAYAKVLATIHTTQDRIRLDLQRQEKEQEKQTKDQEGQLINSAYQRLNAGKLTTAELDELANLGTFTEHRDEYRGLLNGLQAQAKAGGVGDPALAERMQRALYMGVTYTKAQLADPRLNWDQQKANFELAEKVQAQARADHWSRQPDVQVQYKVLDNKHHISNSLFSENPPPRVANVQKMWTDLMDAAAKKGEPLGPAAERIVKQVDAAFPVQEGWRDLPQPTHPGLVPFLKSVTDPKAKTKLTAPQAHAAILRMVQTGQLNLDDPAVREQVGRLIDILDVLPTPTEVK
jgi:hypothetical protein